jgi:hypothetical protein
VNYARRLRQKGARAKGTAGRDRHSHRAAPARRWRVSDNAGKPDFAGFAGRRAVRAFENGAKATTSRLRLFELAAQRKKARVFIAFALRPDGRSAILYWLAGVRVFELGPQGKKARVFTTFALRPDGGSALLGQLRAETGRSGCDATASERPGYASLRLLAGWRARP